MLRKGGITMRRAWTCACALAFFGASSASPAADPTFFMYTVPTVNGAPAWMAVGADGNVWFTESATQKIGKISAAGVIAEYDVPGVGPKPLGIALGPDGNIWFTEFEGF